MPAVGIHITNLQQVKDGLARVAQRLGDKEVERIVAKAARPMQKAMQALAPVDTGNLRKSIKITRLGRRYRGPKGGVAVGPTRPMGAHAWLVENGSRGVRKIKGFRAVRIGGRWTRITHTGVMPARPFVMPAYERTKDTVIQELERLTSNALKGAGV